MAEVTRQLLELKNEDWQNVLMAVTRLFQLRKCPELALELHLINERLINISKSDIGQFAGEFYQDHILTKCMIILRQDIIESEEKGANLLEKLSEIWVQFYTSILPTLLAMFAPIQLKNLSVRALTLIGFRDTVLLKTDVAEALHSHNPPSTTPHFRQMLLVLQSVHRNPPTEQFFILQGLVSKVVRPYLSMVARPRPPTTRAPSEPLPEDLPRRSSRADTVVDNADMAALLKKNSHRRVHSLGHIDEPSNSD